MDKFQQIEQIYQATSTLTNFKSTFEHLNNLNNILRQNLPDNLTKLCHVGAIDTIKHTVVIFVSDSQVLHILKGMSEKLLHAFYVENYSFDKLLLKVNLTNIAPRLIKNRPLESTRKAKLSELAIAIGKPELIIDHEDECNDDEDEIVF